MIITKLHFTKKGHTIHHHIWSLNNKQGLNPSCLWWTHKDAKLLCKAQNQTSELWIRGVLIYIHMYICMHICMHVQDLKDAWRCFYELIYIFWEPKCHVQPTVFVAISKMRTWYSYTEGSELSGDFARLWPHVPGRKWLHNDNHVQCPTWNDVNDIIHTVCDALNSRYYV